MQAQWLNKFVALAAALIWATTPVLAQDFFVVPGTAQRSLTETATMSRATCVTATTNVTVYSLAPAIPAGSSETDTGLLVAVVLGEDALATFNVTNVSIGNITAVEVVDEDGSGIVDAALFRGPVEQPWSAATAVDVTFSEPVTSATLCVWMLKGLQSLTPTSFVQDDDLSLIHI